jgi:DNA repair exonuclease SbcCD nuclease subunit
MDSDPLIQVAFLRQWIEKAHRAGKKILLCDGNHDSLAGVSWPTNQPPSAWSDFCSRAQIGEHWTNALLEEGASVVGGMTEVIAGDLIVTSLRYATDESSAVSLLEKGASLRRAQRLPWVLLHHEPPPGVLGHPALASPALAQWIHDYAPTAVFCGHDHHSPLRNETCFERIGLSRVFNVGHDASAKRPLTVTIDTTSMRFSWSR